MPHRRAKAAAARPAPVETERREIARVPLRFFLPYHRTERQDELLSGTARDVSAAGLLFTSEHKVEVGERLGLILDELPGGRGTRPIGARVIRVELLEQGKGFLVGVEFLDLDAGHRAEIERALETTDVMGLLREAAQAGASDLHLAAEHPPLVRVHGELQPLREEPMTGPDVRDMVYTLLDDHHREAFERELELDFSLTVPPQWRFRVNVHSQRGNVEASFRRIEPLVRGFGELNLPRGLADLAELTDGLVILTGPTGSGKTTAAAAMIEHINATRAAVVVTMENPIEYLFTYRRSVIKQREIGLDTLSYAAGLREAMRQDPDVIFIGEVRDEETMQAAIEAAQTGHLVIATFSSASCVHAIIRLYQFFRRGRQGDIQVQLANCLRGIVALRLLQRKDGPGLIPATEILLCTPAIANMIRIGSTAQIKTAMQAGASFGMSSFESSLAKLRAAGLIDKATHDAVLASL